MKIKRKQETEEILLKFITRYEKLIDSNRINKHEMLNNLLILNSYKNKNSKEYQQILDDIIKLYNTPNSRNISSLYNLPSGLKGIIYYKINIMEENNIEYILNISKPTEKKLLNLDNTIYYNICKIIGILLDNAIEASKNIINKKIVIDLYLDKGNLIIYIENSYNGKVDITKIKQKGYSTKNKKSGYGLFIVDKIISKNKKLELCQESKENKFISVLKIKK